MGAPCLRYELGHRSASQYVTFLHLIGADTHLAPRGSEGANSSAQEIFFTLAGERDALDMTFRGYTVPFPISL